MRIEFIDEPPGAHEAYIVRQLTELREQYSRAAQPLVDELVRIAASKTRRIVLIPEPGDAALRLPGMEA